MLCFYANARSLVNKVDTLRMYAAEVDPTLIFITETWAHDELPDAYFSIPNYTLYRCDRAGRRGGGVMIYVKCDVLSSYITRTVDKAYDAISIFIINDENEKIGFSCVYRPPNVDINDDSLYHFLNNSFEDDYANYCIVGDFNYPEIDWCSSSIISVIDNPLVEWYFSNYLIQNVCNSTRRQSDSLLDLIFTTNGLVAENVQIMDTFDKSDHSIIQWELELLPYKPPTNASRKMYLYSKAKWKQLRKLINDFDWSYLDNVQNVNDIWIFFLESFKHMIESCIPSKSKTIWSPKCCSYVRTALRRRRRCCVNAKLNPSLLNSIKLQVAEENLIEKKKKAVYEHEKKVALQYASNKQSFWKYVNSKLKTNHIANTFKGPNDEAIYHGNDISESFNDYFSTAFSNLGVSGRDYHSIAVNQTYDSMILPCFSPENVFKVLNTLPNSGTVDIDNLSYVILKKVAFFLSPILSKLFNLSFQTATIPDGWRLVMITPIHKSGAKNVISNYRPVAISSVVCRVMERIVRESIVTYCLDNEIIHSSQHGFLPGKSTETAGLSFFDFLCRNADLSYNIDVLFLDYKKAFESVPHDRLVSKMVKYGFDDVLLKWIRNYFNDRKQMVIYNGHRSSLRHIRSGVIQGSVLGPILFDIYMNDFEVDFEYSFVVKYADDIKLANVWSERGADNDYEDRLQLDVQKLQIWNDTNGMTLNLEKCRMMHIGANNTRIPVHVCGIPIPITNSYKDLGIIITDQLSFDEHINGMVNKARQRLGLIRRTFCHCEQQISITLYKTHVRSVLEYGSLIWHPYKVKNINKIEGVQRRMTGSFQNLRHLPYRERLKELNLLSLSTRRIRYQLIFLYKMFHGRINVDFRELFHVVTDFRTRGNHLRIQPKNSRHDYRRHFFTSSIAKYWNMLSDDEINNNSLSQFKSTLQSLFLRLDMW